MNPASTIGPTEAPSTGTLPARIVLIYDRFDMAVRGKAFCDGLSRKLEVRIDLGESVWRCDLFGIPEIREEAAHAAVTADFVVLALRGDEELSPALYRWFGEWLPFAHERDITCVLLFDPVAAQRETTTQIIHFLREATRASDVDFFAHTAGMAGETTSGRGEQEPPAEMETGIGEPGAGRWGTSPALRRPARPLIARRDRIRSKL